MCIYILFFAEIFLVVVYSLCPLPILYIAGIFFEFDFSFNFLFIVLKALNFDVKFISPFIKEKIHIFCLLLKKDFPALKKLSGWALSVKPKGTGSVPGPGTCLGCRPGLWLGVCKWPPISVSLSHYVSSLPSPL